jgi:aminopeptidase N
MFTGFRWAMRARSAICSTLESFEEVSGEVVTQQYKYRREDFGPMKVKLNHLTLYINFLDDFVEVTNMLDITATVDLGAVELDAKNLEILEVRWIDDPSDSDASGRMASFHYDKQRDKLTVEPPESIQPGKRFGVRTVSRCTPSDNLLEGIYKDATPPGAPQQYMSQCQQWGFQRIAPIFDDCRAKCTMTTTIEADSSYVRMISNGNICPDLNPDGKPVPKPGSPGRQIV